MSGKVNNGNDSRVVDVRLVQWLSNSRLDGHDSDCRGRALFRKGEVGEVSEGSDLRGRYCSIDADGGVLLVETCGMLDRCVDWLSCDARNVVYSWGVVC